MRPQIATNHPRVVASLPFVEQLARRVAATMPHSIDIGDLVQDGVIGLIDAAHRFDESRGIKFETCLLYTSPSPRDISGSRMPSSA